MARPAPTHLTKVGLVGVIDINSDIATLNAQMSKMKKMMTY